MPKSSNTLVSLALLTFAIQTRNAQANLYSEAQAKEVSSTRQDHCSGLELRSELKSEAQLHDARQEAANSFSGNRLIFVEFFADRSYHRAVDPKLGLLVLALALVCAGLLTVAISAVNLCRCCCRQKWKRQVDGSWSAWLVLLCLLGFVAGGFTVALFSFRARKRMTEAECRLATLIDVLVNGDRDRHNFIGLRPLQVTISEFQVDFDKLLSNHESALREIRDLDLATKASGAIDALDSFCGDCRDRQTPDGRGRLETPKSTGDELGWSTLLAKIEFNVVSMFVRVIEAGVVTALDIMDNLGTDQIQANLDSLSDFLSIRLAQVHSMHSRSRSLSDRAGAMYILAQAVFFCVLLLVVVGGILALVRLRRSFETKRLRRPCCLRASVLAAGICAAVLSVVCFAAGVLSFASTGSCDVLANLDEPAGIDDFAAVTGLSESAKDTLSKCLSSQGNPTEAFLGLPDGSLDQENTLVFALDLLRLVFDFDLKFPTLSGDGQSASLRSFRTLLERTRSGEILDHDNVEARLSGLNSVVSCSGRVYILNSEACSAQAPCPSLKTTDSYAKPPCADAQRTSEAQDAVQDLHAYINGTAELVDHVVQETFESASSPGKLYEGVLDGLDTMTAKLNLIKDDMKEALGSVDTDVLSATDCRFLRTEVRLLEDSLCFGFVPEAFALFVASLSAVSALLAGALCLLCSVCCLERSPTYTTGQPKFWAEATPGPSKRGDLQFATDSQRQILSKQTISVLSLSESQPPSQGQHLTELQK